MKEIAFGLKIPCFVPISNLAKVDHALPLRWPTSMCCQNWNLFTTKTFPALQRNWKRQRRATLGSLGGMRNQRVNFYQQLHLPIGPSRKYTLLICFVLLTQPTHVQRPLVIWIISLLLLMIPNQMSNGWVACCCIGTQTRVPTKPLYLEFSPSMNFAMSKSRYRSRRLAHPLIRFICW